MQEEARDRAAEPLPVGGVEEECVPFFQVPSSGARVNIFSSIPILHYFCAKLPSDK